MRSRIATALAVWSIAAVLLPEGAPAQTSAANAGPGLAVGEKAPAFQLTGNDGQEHTLAELLANGKLALVFQRSADW